MRTRFLVALLAGALVACASGGAPPASQLRFLDSEIFEKQLHNSLAADFPEVMVVFAGTDATVNEIPDRIDKWLFTVAKKEGKVDFQPDPTIPAGRNPIGLALTFGVGAYKLITEYTHYAPAGNFNAVVFYHPSEGTLTRVVFMRRPESN